MGVSTKPHSLSSQRRRKQGRQVASLVKVSKGVRVKGAKRSHLAWSKTRKRDIAAKEASFQELMGRMKTMGDGAKKRRPIVPCLGLSLVPATGVVYTRPSRQRVKESSLLGPNTFLGEKLDGKPCRNEAVVAAKNKRSAAHSYTRCFSFPPHSPDHGWVTDPRDVVCGKSKCDPLQLYFL